MALLASCWLIVESFIIPDGFLKWFYLSFYIHPLLLVFCQIFLWLKLFKKWLLLLFFPLTIVFRLCLFVLGSLKRAAISLFSFTRPTTDEVYYDALEPDIPILPSQDCEIVVSCSSRSWYSTCSPCNESRVQSGVLGMGNMSKAGPVLGTDDVAEEENGDDCIKDSWLNEYLYSDHYNNSISKYDLVLSESLLPDQDNSTSFRFSFMDQSVDFKSHETINQEFMFVHEPEDSENSSSDNSCDPQLVEHMPTISEKSSDSPVFNFDMKDSSSTTDACYALSATDTLVEHESLPSLCKFNSPVRPEKQQLSITGILDDMDPFHQKYTSRMRFLNVLHHERLHGMNAILNDHITTPGFLEFTGSSTDLPIQFFSWSRMTRKRLLRSLECDLEMIYVAQSCLFWEALHHQYHTVEALTFSDNSKNIVFHHIVAGKFQQLQILMERFVEEQGCECRGSSNNTHKRLSFQGLLQVPDATGFVFMEEDMRGEGMRAAQVLTAIKKCIEAFWLYIKTDEKKSLWKYKGLRRTIPPVEDPQDLELLYHVTKTLYKKGIMLKDLQGKSKCWLRRKVQPLQTEDEKRNLLFAMIDMRLVQRLLKMSLVSSSHLKWCQEKLNNIDFEEGKVFRSRIDHLFPSS